MGFEFKVCVFIRGVEIRGGDGATIGVEIGVIAGDVIIYGSKGKVGDGRCS